MTMVLRLLLAALCLYYPSATLAWTTNSQAFSLGRRNIYQEQRTVTSSLHLSAETSSSSTTEEELEFDYEVPEDAVVMIKPAAMNRLRELRDQQKLADGESLILRMGVRSGGCSGMSYVMDFSTADEIQEDDAVDDYPSERIQCVVDAKSMLYLYGLELDYSNELIGGGFSFYNKNAEETCGCGSSFGV